MIREHVVEIPTRLALATFIAGITVAIIFVAGWGGFWEDAASLALDRESSDKPAGFAYALLVDENVSDSEYTSEIVAFDEATGEVVARLAAGDEPNLVPDPSGDHIYLLETYYTGDGCASGCEVTTGDVEHKLSIIDTQTWETTVSTTVAGRVQYTLAGPPVLVLSPDGKQLAIYSTDQVGEYWIETYDATTLERLLEPEEITLPRGCGGTPIAATRTGFALICGGTKQGNDEEGVIDVPLALQFVDLTTRRVTASTRLRDPGLYVKGKPVGLEVSSDRSTIYVVLNDLMITEIDAVSHQVTSEFTAWQTDQPTVFGATLNGDELLIGVRSSYKTWEDMRLLRFALPALEPLETLSVQEHPRFAPGPDGDLYLWERGSTTLSRLDLSDGSVTMFELGGDKTLIADIVRTE